MTWTSPRARWPFEEVSGVQGSSCATGADDGVQLVDEEDDVAALADLGDELLDTLFKLAAVLGAGDHAGEAERDQPLVLQFVRHVALDDSVSQSFRDGRFADTGIAYQDGVVLGSAQQDFNGTVHLELAADDRIQVAGAGGVGEVAAVFGQHAARLAAAATTAPASATTAAATGRARLVRGLDSAAEGAEVDAGGSERAGG